MEGQWGRVRGKRRNKKCVCPQRKERGELQQTEDTEYGRVSKQKTKTAWDLQLTVKLHFKSRLPP